MKHWPKGLTVFLKTDFRKAGRAISDFGGEGTLDFAAEGQRGRGGRDFVLISAAVVERGNGRRFAPQRWERRRDFSGRGIGDFVLISAASAPLPLCGKPKVPRRRLLEMSFADRSNANEGNVRELSRMDQN